MDLPNLPAYALQPLHRLPGNRRWVVVAILFAGLAVFAPLALAESRGPKEAALRAVPEAGHLIVTWVHPEGMAWDAGIRVGDEVVEVEGRPVGPREDFDTVAAASSVRVRAADSEMTIATSDATYEPPSAPRYAPFHLTIAACFLVVGSVVYLAAATGIDAALALLGVSVAGAAMFVAAVATISGSPLAIVAYNTAWVGLDVALLSWMLVFPVNRTRSSRWGTRLLAAAIVAAAALVAGYLSAVTFWPSAFGPVRFSMNVLEAAIALCCYALFVLALREAMRPGERATVALVGLGCCVGFGVVFFLYSLPKLLGLGEPVPLHAAYLGEALFPVSVGAAVLGRRRFFGVPRLVRRGGVALVVWVALLASYTACFYALWRLAGGGDTPLGAGAGLGLTALCVALIAGTFPVVQAGLRAALNRALFGDVYDYAETLRRLSDETVRLAGVEEIAGHVLGRIGGTLDLSWAAIALESDPAAPAVSGASLYRWGDCPGDLATRLGGRPRDDWSTETGEPTLVPLVAEGDKIGLLAVGPKTRDVELLPEDRALLATLAPLVATALQNVSLVGRLEGQVQVLGDRERELGALSARLMRIQEEERRRLALDLHDEPLQRAALLAREIGGAADCPDSRRWQEAVEDIAASLRAISAGLRPSVLDDLGLAAGLERLVGDLRARSELEVRLSVETPDGRAFGRLGDPELETAMYRVAQEALNNCLKHARATRVAVALRRNGRSVGLRVADDGRGYGAAPPDRRGPRLGILGMRERLRPWAGDVTVGAGEDGTVVSAEAPLPASPGGPGG